MINATFDLGEFDVKCTCSDRESTTSTPQAANKIIRQGVS